MLRRPTIGAVGSLRLPFYLLSLIAQSQRGAPETLLGGALPASSLRARLETHDYRLLTTDYRLL